MEEIFFSEMSISNYDSRQCVSPENQNIYIFTTVLDIIHRPLFHLKHTVSETGFCLRLQVDLTQLGRRRQNPVSEV
jgi:hypothetical protein